jgi:two-component system, NtrC family, response regulator AlgB
MLILIVDDDATTLQLLDKIVRWYGHEVVTARSYKQALALAMSQIQTRRPNCVLTDYNMPGGTGLELIWQLRLIYASKPKVNYALMSGQSYETILAEQLYENAPVLREEFEFLPKPFTPSQVRQLLGRMVQVGQ